MQMVGVALGLGVGLITGVITLLVILAVINNGERIKNPKIITILFSVPVCWIGGGWGNTAILGAINFEEIINIYFTYLISVFMVIIIYPLAKLIIRVGGDTKKQERSQNG